METTKEIATQTVDPIAFEAARKTAQDGLEVRSPNTKLGLRVSACLRTLPIVFLGYFGIVSPLAVHLPANNVAIAAIRATAVNGQLGYAGERDLHSLESDVKLDIVWTVFGSLVTALFLLGNIVGWREKRDDVYPMIAALPGSAHLFLQQNEQRIESLHERCAGLDARLAAFVAGKSAFGEDLQEQYDAAMAQFVEERVLLAAEADRYLEGLREAVGTDRERLRFVDDCSSLAGIRRNLNKRSVPLLSAATRHVAQDIAGAVLTDRLSTRRVELMMPQRLLELKAPYDTRFAPVPQPTPVPAIPAVAPSPDAP